MKKILFLIVLGFIAWESQAQMLGANYQISIPFGKMHDYAKKASFRGANLEYHDYVAEHFTVGGSIGWNTFYEDKGQLSQDFRLSGSNDIYTITGKQYRYINSVPIMVNGRFHPLTSDAKIQPYGGLSLGMRWTEYKTEVGQYTAKLSRWQFAVSPEIGVIVPLNANVAANVGISYNFATRAANGRIPTYNTLMFNIGLLLLDIQD